MSKKVLLSTDIGSDIDDAFSLLTILNSGIDLKGVYTVNGDVESRAYIAKHMVNLSKKDISVAVGESKSINDTIKPYSHFEDCYIDYSFVDEDASVEKPDSQYFPLEKSGIIKNGIDDLIKKLSDEKYTIFNIAPLTNIAKVIEIKPSIVENIEEIYIMGARFNGELEHNFRHDPDAAKSVLESEIPITIIPANLCQKYKMPVETLGQLISPIGKYVKKMAFGFLGIKTAIKFNEPLKEFNEHSLDNIIKHVTLNDFTKYSMIKEKDRLVVDLNDAYCGALDNEDYFKQYDNLIKFFDKNKEYFNFARTVIDILRDLPPKDISISDVYVPYCFLYPDKIKTEKAEIKVEYNGTCRKISGDKHAIVTDLDFNHFKEFINDNLK